VCSKLIHGLAIRGYETAMVENCLHLGSRASRPKSTRRIFYRLFCGRIKFYCKTVMSQALRKCTTGCARRFSLSQPGPTPALRTREITPIAVSRGRAPLAFKSRNVSEIFRYRNSHEGCETKRTIRCFIGERDGLGLD